MSDNKFGEQGRVVQRLFASSLSGIRLGGAPPARFPYSRPGVPGSECLSLGSDTHATSQGTSGNQVNSSVSQICCFVASHVHLYGHSRAHVLF